MCQDIVFAHPAKPCTAGRAVPDSADLRLDTVVGIVASSWEVMAAEMMLEDSRWLDTFQNDALNSLRSNHVSELDDRGMEVPSCQCQMFAVDGAFHGNEQQGGAPPLLPAFEFVRGTRSAAEEATLSMLHAVRVQVGECRPRE
jgi:hypothetical protein